MFLGFMSGMRKLGFEYYFTPYSSVKHSWSEFPHQSSENAYRHSVYLSKFFTLPTIGILRLEISREC